MFVFTSETAKINFHGPRTRHHAHFPYRECRPWNLNEGRSGDWFSFQGKNNAVDNSRLQRNRVPPRRKLTLFLTANRRAIYSASTQLVGCYMNCPLCPREISHPSYTQFLLAHVYALWNVNHVRLFLIGL